MPDTGHKVRIFISWSGDLSNRLAGILRDWLPRVIQAVDPWVSDTDIAKGTFWNAEVIKGLQDAKAGNIILTPDSLEKPWLHFEAGFLARAIQECGGMVAPLLVDVRTSDISGPMSTLQVTSFAKKDVFKLMKAINDQAGDPVTVDILEESFDLRWPKLEEAFASALTNTAARTPKPAIDRDAVMEEILSIVREIANVSAPSNIDRLLFDVIWKNRHPVSVESSQIERRELKYFLDQGLFSSADREIATRILSSDTPTVANTMALKKLLDRARMTLSHEHRDMIDRTETDQDGPGVDSAPPSP